MEKMYPGITEVGTMYNHRRTSSPKAAHLLFFAFKETDKTFNTIIDIFIKFSDYYSVDSFRVVRHSEPKQGFTIEAHFADRIQRRYIIKQAHKNENKITISGGEGNQVCAEVYLPAPKDPLYKVYSIRGLPLDSPAQARKIIEDANIKRIEELTKINQKDWDASNTINDCLVDLVLGSSGYSSTSGRSFYDGSMCIVLKNLSGLYDKCEGSRVLYAYGDKYIFSECSYHYQYCCLCHSIDVHDVVDCPRNGSTKDLLNDL